jgi:hypothetical protein
VNKQVTLREMSEALKEMSDEDVFRWYQTTAGFDDRGTAVGGPALYVTMGEIRRVLAELEVRALEKAFNATPEEIGRAAVEGAVKKAAAQGAIGLIPKHRFVPQPHDESCLLCGFIEETIVEQERLHPD